MVFVADKADASGRFRWVRARHGTSSLPCHPPSPLTLKSTHAISPGLAGFDLPLVYLFKDKLNQPIFGCNNLAGAGGLGWAGCVVAQQCVGWLARVAPAA